MNVVCSKGSNKFKQYKFFIGHGIMKETGFEVHFEKVLQKMREFLCLTASKEKCSHGGIHENSISSFDRKAGDKKVVEIRSQILRAEIAMREN